MHRRGQKVRRHGRQLPGLQGDGYSTEPTGNTRVARDGVITGDKLYKGDPLWGAREEDPLETQGSKQTQGDGAERGSGLIREGSLCSPAALQRLCRIAGPERPFWLFIIIASHTGLRNPAGIRSTCACLISMGLVVLFGIIWNE